MVLESLLRAHARSYKILGMSFLCSFLAIVLSVRMFPAQSSILSVALITMIFIPFFQKMFERDELSEVLSLRNLKDNVFSRHSPTVKAFSMFFLGTALAISTAFFFLPDYAGAFSLQSDTLRSFATGRATDTGTMIMLMLNNTQVMLLMFILSTILGAGAILILAWNASVIGVYVGMVARAFSAASVDPAFAYLYGVNAGLFSIALHGIPEIMAYFVAGIAGGILSVGMAREDVQSLKFKRVLVDSLKLLVLAQVMIAGAAWLEVAF